MFSNLIAASMDSDYNTSIQNSFVEIIKQLTPYDAKLFKTFFHHGGNPAMSVIKRNQNESLEILIELFYKNYYFQDYILNEISINNLERLGLIQIKYNEYISSGKNIVYDTPRECYVPYQRAKWGRKDIAFKAYMKDLEDISHFHINFVTNEVVTFNKSAVK